MINRFKCLWFASAAAAFAVTPLANAEEVATEPTVSHEEFMAAIDSLDADMISLEEQLSEFVHWESRRGGDRRESRDRGRQSRDRSGRGDERMARGPERGLRGPQRGMQQRGGMGPRGMHDHGGFNRDRSRDDRSAMRRFDAPSRDRQGFNRDRRTPQGRFAERGRQGRGFEQMRDRFEQMHRQRGHQPMQRNQSSRRGQWGPQRDRGQQQMQQPGRGFRNDAMPSSPFQRDFRGGPQGDSRGPGRPDAFRGRPGMEQRDEGPRRGFGQFGPPQRDGGPQRGFGRPDARQRDFAPRGDARPQRDGDRRRPEAQRDRGPQRGFGQFGPPRDGEGRRPEARDGDRPRPEAQREGDRPRGGEYGQQRRRWAPPRPMPDDGDDAEGDDDRPRGPRERRERRPSQPVNEA